MGAAGAGGSREASARSTAASSATSAGVRSASGTASNSALLCWRLSIRRVSGASRNVRSSRAASCPPFGVPDGSGTCRSTPHIMLAISSRTSTTCSCAVLCCTLGVVGISTSRASGGVASFAGGVLRLNRLQESKSALDGSRSGSIQVRSPNTFVSAMSLTSVTVPIGSVYGSTNQSFAYSSANSMSSSLPRSVVIRPHVAEVGAPVLERPPARVRRAVDGRRHERVHDALGRLRGMRRIAEPGLLRMVFERVPLKPALVVFVGAHDGIDVALRRGAAEAVLEPRRQPGVALGHAGRQDQGREPVPQLVGERVERRGVGGISADVVSRDVPAVEQVFEQCDAVHDARACGVAKLPLQHSDLVAQREDLDVLGAVAHRDQAKQGEGVGQAEVGQSQ